MTSIRVRTLVVLAVVTPACPATPTGPTAAHLQVTGPSVLYGAPGEVEAYTATVAMPDGTTSDQTLQATWSSSNGGVLAALSSGHVQSVGAGTATLTATIAGVSGSVVIQVTPPTWRFVGTPTLTHADTQTYLLAVDPRDDATMYVGTLTGLYVTRDGGGSWQMPVTGFIDAIAVDPAAPDTVYALAGARAVMRSIDRGNSFATLFTSNDVLESIQISTTAPGTLYLGYGGLQDPNPSGVLRSTDGGTSWQQFPFGPPGPLIVWSVAEDPLDGTLYAGTEIANHPQPYRPPFFKSVDRGQTWTDATGVLPWHVVHISVNPSTHAVLALTEGAGLWLSPDHASSWSLLDNHFDMSLLMDPRNPVRLFGGDYPSGTRTSGAYISTDGAHFVAFGLDHLQLADFALNGGSSRLYAACYNSGIYVTDIAAPQ